MTVVHFRRWSRLVKRLLAVGASNKIGKAERGRIDRFSLLFQPSDTFFSYPSFVYAPHLVQAFASGPWRSSVSRPGLLLASRSPIAQRRQFSLFDSENGVSYRLRRTKDAP